MLASWTWSLALIVLTTAMHSFGIVVLSLIGVRVHAYLKGQPLHFWQAVMILTMVIGAIGLSLAVLHGLEAALWAGAYLWLGAIDTLVQALLFSVDSMTTRGASGLVLHQHWQLMGCPSSNGLGQSGVFGTEALARLGLRLGGFQLMLQSSQFDGVAFDPFSF
jgi:hypothetical protein